MLKSTGQSARSRVLIVEVATTMFISASVCETSGDFFSVQ